MCLVIVVWLFLMVPCQEVVYILYLGLQSLPKYLFIGTQNEKYVNAKCDRRFQK